jgi:hypothetical protein
MLRRIEMLNHLGEGMLRSLVFSASMFTLLMAQAQAATLQLEGLASVDAGRGFAPATNNMLLNPGDRIRAGKGCALIVYNTGYLSKVCNGQMAVVLSDPPQPNYAGSLKDTPAYVSEETASGDPLTAGLLVGTGVALAVTIANSNSNPSSP